MHLSDAHHFRKMVAGACMVLAPALLLVSVVIHPEMGTSAASQAAAIASDRDQWYSAHLIGLVSIVLAVPAVLGLMHMLRERRVAEGHVGGALAMIGLLAFVGIVAMEMVFWAADTPALETAVLIDRVEDSAGIMGPFYFASFGFAAGMMILAYGLYSARAVSAWMAGSLGLGALALAIAFPSATEWLSVVAAALLFVGFASTGWMVLKETDEEWDHTPEFHGFRPAAGTP